MKPTSIAAVAFVLVSTAARAQRPAPGAPGPAAAPEPAAAPPAASPGAAAAAPAAPEEAPAAAPSPDVPPARGEEAGNGAPDLSTRAGAWSFRPFGHLRMGYEHVQKDSRFDFIGRNNGFVLESARLGMEARHGDDLTMRLSVDGAAGEPSGINTPQGTLDVNLRDAYARYDPTRYVGVQVGQFFAPFAAEEMRSSTDLLFASRAVGQEGVLPGRGIEQPALALDRQLGVMLSPRDPITVGGGLGIMAYAMLANGNGPNQLLNDDSSPAFTGRVELSWKKLARLGGAFEHNGRRTGTPPDQLDETDNGFAADLLVTPGDLEVFGQLVQVKTTFDTAGGADRTQRALSAQAGYRIRTRYVHVTPAYRFAYFDPWASGDTASSGAALDTFRLMYHTFGARLEHPSLPLKLFVDYTLTGEKDPHKLDNDRLQILAQAAF